MLDQHDQQSRIDGAITGMFIGDALAMPVHWYYDRHALDRDYGWVTDYLAPRNPHPDSILWRSNHTPLTPDADILHDQASYWGQPGIHYHQFLLAGENTLNLKLISLLIRSLVNCGGYDASAFLEDYVAFMTTPGNHRDTYVEEYHRHFFNHRAAGKPLDQCGVAEKHVSGVIGMIPIAAYYARDPDRARRAAHDHRRLTHRGERMRRAGDLLLDILLPVLAGERLADVITHKIRRQDNLLLGHPLMSWLNAPDAHVIGRRLSTACYVDDAVPATIYLALKYHDDVHRGLIANTNLGGDNAGRGALLGALLGAANGRQAFPHAWVTGLREPPPPLLRPDQASPPIDDIADTTEPSTDALTIGTAGII